MKQTITSFCLVILTISLAVFSCDTIDTDTSFDPILTGRMRIVFDNVADAADLKLYADPYQNAIGESFVVTKFNYFVSNIRLRRDDGSEYVVPQDSSYFLIQEDKPASQTITLANVPTGNYTALTFLIGVDSLRSMADITKWTGVLDPAQNDGMYWEWNSGYIFLKLEGTSAVAPAAQNNAFFYHVGGFGRGNVKINNLRTITLPFKTDVATVQAGSLPTVRLNANMLSLFNGPTKVSIAQHPSVMFEPYSTNIADNYAQMFSYDRIQIN